MDGTLVDSEGNTDRSVDRLLSEAGVLHDRLDYRQFHGRTWAAGEEILQELYPQLRGEDLARPLQEHFQRLFVEEHPPFIPGARKALHEACQQLPTAVVSSSNQETVEGLIDRMEARPKLRLWVCAEDASRSKPHPEVFLRAAAGLGVQPERCLVFEDSLPGLQAANRAGMTTVAIVPDLDGPGANQVKGAANHVIKDFTSLPPDFFQRISG